MCVCLDVTPANASADAAASRRTQTCSGTGTNGCAGRDLPSRDRVERRLPRARTRGHARGHRAKQQRAAPRWHCHARGAGRYGVVRSGLQLSLPWVGSRPVTAGAGPRRLSSLVGAGTASVEQAGRRGRPCTDAPRRVVTSLCCCARPCGRGRTIDRLSRAVSSRCAAQSRPQSSFARSGAGPSVWRCQFPLAHTAQLDRLSDASLYSTTHTARGSVRTSH